MPEGYTHLTPDDRCQIEVLLRRGDGNRAIGRLLGRPSSTIRREIARNAGLRGYRKRQAQLASSARRSAASQRAKKMTPEVIAGVEAKLLEEQWSPEQISGWMRRQETPGASGANHANAKPPWVSHERIYQHVWQDKKAGGSLWRNLRHNGKKYNKRKGLTSGRGCIPNRIDISQRPAIVEQKARIGDWEIDTVIGAGHKGALVTAVDRMSKYVVIEAVANKTAEAVTAALVGRLTALCAKVLTITADNGREFAGHQQISLNLDLRANQHGRDDYAAFVRKVLPERLKGLPQQSVERESFERDIAGIQAYLHSEVDRSANGLALFACAGADLFEAIQLDAPIEQHWLFIGTVPHLYPLARLMNMYPRYAAVLLDTNKARIFVFGLAALERSEHVTGEKTRRHSQGGWSQARYQRHIENLHLRHVKDVIDNLDALVRDEEIEHIVAAGSDEALALLRGNLPAHLAAKLEATTKLDLTASDADVLQATLESFRDRHAETDAERVEELLNAWRSGGLGVAGPEATLRALELGQVDEMVIAGSPDTLKTVQRMPDDAVAGPVQADTSAPQGAGDEMRLTLSSELVLRAEQTSARIRFIKDPALLADIGGVGALLRFRI